MVGLLVKALDGRGVKGRGGKEEECTLSLASLGEKDTGVVGCPFFLHGLSYLPFTVSCWCHWCHVDCPFALLEFTILPVSPASQGFPTQRAFNKRVRE